MAEREAWEMRPLRPSEAARAAEALLKDDEAVERLLEDVAKLSIESQSRPAEQRVVNEKTGGAKGSKLCQLAWAAPAGLHALGEVYGFGASKYDPSNYRKGYDWSLSLSALWRHILAFQGGEDLDPESGLPHMAHAGWHCLTLIQFMADHPELDDRYKPASD